jgi:arabinose-5-phosphate isomerase
MLAAEALNIMERKRINGLIVINEQNQPIGALNMQDLLKAGVI